MKYSFSKTVKKGLVEFVLLFLVGGIAALANADFAKLFGDNPILILAIPFVKSFLTSLINWIKNYLGPAILAHLEG